MTLNNIYQYCYINDCPGAGRTSEQSGCAQPLKLATWRPIYAPCDRRLGETPEEADSAESEHREFVQDLHAQGRFRHRQSLGMLAGPPCDFEAEINNRDSRIRFPSYPSRFDGRAFQSSGSTVCGPRAIDSSLLGDGRHRGLVAAVVLPA
jgi:hypothetical protein